MRACPGSCLERKGDTSIPKRTTKRTRVAVIGGVDTHGRTHYTAVIDQQGQLLGDREFPADSGGYRQLLAGCVATGTWPQSGSKALAATAPA